MSPKGNCVNHPDRAIYAKGFCQYCYLKNRLKVINTVDEDKLEREWAAKGFRGLTIGVFKAIVASQNGLCKCCGLPNEPNFDGGVDPLTLVGKPGGGVRGLVCNKCKGIVGMYNDPVKLRASIAIYNKVADFLENS